MICRMLRGKPTGMLQTYCLAVIGSVASSADMLQCGLQASLTVCGSLKEPLNHDGLCKGLSLGHSSCNITAEYVEHCNTDMRL